MIWRRNTWVDTVHAAKISGGAVANIISDHAEALLDFRLIENSTLKNLDSCMEKGVSYEIVSSSIPVVMDENNPHIQKYKKLAENVLGGEIKFVQIGGATDSREFAARGATVIMHSGSGEGMHTNEEYVVVDTIKKIADIQKKFLEMLSS